MRAVLSRLVATTIGAAMLVAPVPDAGASAAVAGAGSTLSDQYCNAFVDYYTVYFVAGFAAALTKAFSGAANSDQKKKPPSPEEVRSTFLLVFSPKLERVSGVLGKSGEPLLRPLFQKQRVVFAHGSGLLEGVGLTRKQIDLLAKAPLNIDNTKLQDLTGKVHLNVKKLMALAKQFQRELVALERNRPNKAASAAFLRVGSQCGAFPSSTVDCAKVLPETEAATILGDTVTQDRKGCAYEAPKPTAGLTPKVGVEVYESARAYDRLVKSLTGQAVQGVGDRAIASDGYSAYGNAMSCGRTLVVAAGDRTITVALCLANHAAVPDAQLVGIAQGVLTRLG